MRGSRYDVIGSDYAATRREDPRIASKIHAALGGARTVVNVGAGAGAYEPRDRNVIPIEPSETMIAQRDPSAAPAIRGGAWPLPLDDQSVDAAMAILTVHHWDDDQERGVREMRRVARGPVVILTVDAEVSARMWLIADYFPEVAELDRRTFPPLETLARWLDTRVDVHEVPIHRDTPDWTLASFWAHPERVLDERARKATSGFARMPAHVVNRVVNAVDRDLENGTWEARRGYLRALEEYDAGVRLVVSNPGSSVHSRARTARAAGRV
jgi:SAM-dependent methyltransferase